LKEESVKRTGRREMNMAMMMADRKCGVRTLGHSHKG
jgi:hypothetical protein